jgi:hypothetical protein
MARAGPERREFLRIALDGPGMTPETVDAPAMLRIARDYFELIQRTAEEQGRKIRLEGLYVRSGSVAIETRSTDPEAAQAATTRTRAWLAGEEAPPHGFNQPVKALLDSIVSLPEGVAVRAGGQDWEEILVVCDAPPPASDFTEQTTLRGYVREVGGDSPHVVVDIAIEQRRGLRLLIASKTMARDIARELYREAELELRLVRSGDGRILSGQLLAFKRVEDANSRRRWSEWFRPLAARWASVTDIEAELGRG